MNDASGLEYRGNWRVALAIGRYDSAVGGATLEFFKGRYPASYRRVCGQLRTWKRSLRFEPLGRR